MEAKGELWGEYVFVLSGPVVEPLLCSQFFSWLGSLCRYCARQRVLVVHTEAWRPSVPCFFPLFLHIFPCSSGLPVPFSFFSIFPPLPPPPSQRCRLRTVSGCHCGLGTHHTPGGNPFVDSLTSLLWVGSSFSLVCCLLRHVGRFVPFCTEARPTETSLSSFSWVVVWGICCLSSWYSFLLAFFFRVAFVVSGRL